MNKFSGRGYCTGQPLSSHHLTPHLFPSPVLTVPSLTSPLTIYLLLYPHSCPCYLPLFLAPVPQPLHVFLRDSAHRLIFSFGSPASPSAMRSPLTSLPLPHPALPCHPSPPSTYSAPSHTCPPVSGSLPAHAVPSLQHARPLPPPTPLPAPLCQGPCPAPCVPP